MGNGRATRALLACGVVGPPVFVGVFLIDGATRAGYDPWRHWVSHLSLGGRGWLGVANLIFFGLLMLGFSSGLGRVFRSGKGSVWGPRLISLLGLGLILGGVFTIDPGLGYPPGTPQSAVTWHGRVEKIVAFARRTGNRKSPSGPFGHAVRDLVLPFFLKMGVKAVEPVYSYRVRWDEKAPV